MFDIMGVNPADKLCESGDWAWEINTDFFSPLHLNI